MVRGFDIGTAELIATTDDEGQAGVSQPPRVVQLAADTVETLPLSADDLAHVEEDGVVYVLGEDAVDVAGQFDRQVGSLLSRGLLCEEWPPGLFGELAGEILASADEVGEPLVYTAPGAVAGLDRSAQSHRETVERALEDFVYEPTPIHEGLAVLYGTADTDATGLGISVGAGTTDVCLADGGAPAVALSLPLGGDWLDDRAARDAGEPVETVRIARESGFAVDDSPGSAIEAALVAAHEDLVEAVVEAVAIESAARAPADGAVPVTIAGRSAAVGGIEQLFRERLEAADVPFDLGDVTRPPEPGSVPLRGAFRAARADEYEPAEDVVWAPADEAVAGVLDGLDVGTGTARSGAGRPAVSPGSPGEGAEDGFDAEELAERLSELDGEVATLDDELEDLAAGSAAEDAVAALRDRVGALGEEVASLAAASPDAAAVDTLASDLASLEDAVEGLVADVDALESEAATAADVDALEADLEAVATDLAALESGSATEAEVQTVEEAVDDLASRLAAVESELEDVPEIESTVDAVEDLRTTVEDLPDDVLGRAEFEEVTDSLRTALADARALASDDGTVDVAAVETLSGDVEALRAELSALDTDVAEVHDVLADVQGDVADAHAEIEDVDGEVDSVRDDLDGLAATVTDLRKSVAGLPEEAPAATTVAELSADVASLESDLEAIEAGSASGASPERLDDLEASLAALRETVADLEAAVADPPVIESIESDLAALTTDLEALEDGLAALEDEVTAIEAAEADRVAPERVEQVETDLQAATEDLRASVEAVEGELEEAPSAEAVASLRADVESLAERAEAGADAAAVEDLRATLEAVAKHVEGLDGRIEDVDERLEGVADDEALAPLRERVDAVESTLDEALAETERIADLHETVADLESRAAAQSELDSLEGTVSGISVGVDDVTERLEPLEDRTETLWEATEPARAGGGLAPREAVESLRAEVDDVRERLDGEATDVAALAATVEDLAGTVESLDAAVEDLTAENGSHARRQRNQQQIAKLRAEVSDLRGRLRAEEAEVVRRLRWQLVAPLLAVVGVAGLAAAGFVAVVGRPTSAGAIAAVAVALLAYVGLSKRDSLRRVASGG